jgi:hypothetical protein
VFLIFIGVFHFLSFSLLLIASHAGCAVDEDGAEAEGLANQSVGQTDSMRHSRSQWALVIPRGIGSLASINLSEIDLLDRVRVAVQIAQGCFEHLLCLLLY